MQREKKPFVPEGLLTTNLPSGENQIQDHLASGQSLQRNVGKEADEAYIAEKGLRIGAQVMTSWPVGKCSRCLNTIYNAPFVKAGKEYCSQTCRDGVSSKGSTKEADRQMDRQQAKWDKLAAKRATKTGNLPTGWLWCAYERCHSPFRPARAKTVACSPRCKYRWQQSQPLPGTAVSL